MFIKILESVESRSERQKKNEQKRDLANLNKQKKQKQPKMKATKEKQHPKMKFLIKQTVKTTLTTFNQILRNSKPKVWVLEENHLVNHPRSQ